MYVFLRAVDGCNSELSLYIAVIVISLPISHVCSIALLKTHTMKRIPEQPAWLMLLVRSHTGPVIQCTKDCFPPCAYHALHYIK